MEKVKTSSEYTIYKKRSGRYGVKSSSNKWINGEEKAKILAAEGLIKLTAPAAVESTEETEQESSPQAESSEQEAAPATE